jgi:predicted deacylase
MESFAIGNIVVQPGSVAKGILGTLYLSNGSSVDIPLMVVHGSRPGPVLWVSAAMHGQELSGIGVVWELVRQRLNPATLSGTVVAAPLLNPLSFNGGTYYTPQDGYNVNRVFPGDPKGLTTQRLANMILEGGVKRADFLIDFHANTEPAMCFTIVKESKDEEVWNASRAMAKAFGITVVEMVLKYEAHRMGTMTDMAISLRKPSITIELIPWRRMSPKAVSTGVRGVLNVMKHLGMIGGEQEAQNEVLVIPGRMTRTELMANRGGLVRFLKDAGDPVKKGEVVAEVVDHYGEAIEDVVSPVDGWQLAFPLLDNQAVNTGDLLAFFLFPKVE